MPLAQIVEGDPVRITFGVYKDAEGIVEDLQPECSTVRVHTKEGNAYAYVEALAKIVKPIPIRKPNALVK